MTIHSLDVLFPSLEPVHYSMPGSNCCFSICIHISQEASKVVWYSVLFKNFPVVVIHPVKGFSAISEAEVDVFMEFSCFSMIQRMMAVWIAVPLPFLNPAWTYGSSWFTHYWILAWRILSITLLACEMNVIVWTFFGFALLWDWNENWLFLVLWSLLIFSVLLA